MSAEKLLNRLQGVRSMGHNRWIAICPAHEDKRPSLSIREKEDDKVLIKCWTGCSATDIIAAAGLEMRDLMSDKERDNYERRHTDGNTSHYPSDKELRELVRYLYKDLVTVQLGAAQLGLGIDIEVEDLRTLWKTAERLKRLMDKAGV